LPEAKKSPCYVSLNRCNARSFAWLSVASIVKKNNDMAIYLGKQGWPSWKTKPGEFYD
jgi:hypothetical protein